MKKTIGIWLLLLGLGCHLPALSQVIYGISAQHDSLWAIDTTHWTVVGRRQCTIQSDSILGIHGLACSPVHHQCYAVASTQIHPTSRILTQIDLATGSCSFLGDIGDQVGSITFREDGQLLGIVEDGGNSASSLFFIDASNGQVNFATHFGNGDAGEVVAFHADDHLLYHWSGSANRVMEKLLPNVPFPAPTPVTTTDYSAQVAAAMDLGNANFLVSDTTKHLRRVSAAGEFGPPLMATTVQISGLAMPPAFKLVDNFLCIRDTVVVTFQGVASDTAFFDWDDGTVTTTYPATTATHVYSSSGNYVLQVGMKNPFSGLDTLDALSLRVNNLPGVGLNPYRDTLLCQADTLRITGQFGGTSRWFRNGIQIPGANTNVYDATLNGWYNMAKTNLNGCTDSSYRGIYIVFANQLTGPEILVDSADCPTIHFTGIYPFSTSWVWTFGDGATRFDSLPSHTYGSAGAFRVTLVATNACGSASVFATVTIDCPIGQPETFQRWVQVAPNPNSGQFVIQLDLPAAKPIHYRISDLTGREILHRSQERPVKHWSEAIDLAVPQGMYLLELTVGNEVATYRILVE